MDSISECRYVIAFFIFSIGNRQLEIGNIFVELRGIRTISDCQFLIFD